MAAAAAWLWVGCVIVVRARAGFFLDSWWPFASLFPIFFVLKQQMRVRVHSCFTHRLWKWSEVPLARHSAPPTANYAVWWWHGLLLLLSSSFTPHNLIIIEMRGFFSFGAPFTRYKIAPSCLGANGLEHKKLKSQKKENVIVPNTPGQFSPHLCCSAAAHFVENGPESFLFDGIGAIRSAFWVAI